MLKWYLIAAALAFGGYQWHLRQQNPDIIENPVYVEYRVDIEIPGHTINAVLFGAMASHKECSEKAEQMWRDTLTDCELCQFKSSTCKEELPTRYAGIFDGEPLNTSYMSFNRGARHERDGRLIFWGLTDQQSEQICAMVERGMRQHYQGQVDCIVGGS